MLFKLIFIILFYNNICYGDDLNILNPGPNTGFIRPLKPCPHKTGSIELVNTYRRRINLPNRAAYSANADLVSQSLKDGGANDQFAKDQRKLENDLQPQETNHLANVFVEQNKDYLEENNKNEEAPEPCKEHLKTKLNKLDSNADNDAEQKLLKKLIPKSNNNENVLSDTKTSNKKDDALKKDKSPNDCGTPKSDTSEENYFSGQSRRFLKENNDDLDTEVEHTNDRRGNPDESLKFLDSDKSNDEGHLYDPIKGEGVARLTDNTLALRGSSRICYACSSATNPNCWIPNRQTTVKYCRKGHNSCMTKVFKTQNAEVLIRDCGSSCVSTDTVNSIFKYKTCSICHKDLCNETSGAYSISSQNLIVTLIVISIIRISSSLPF